MGDDTLPPLLRPLATAMRARKNRAVRTNRPTMHLVDVYREGRRLLRVAVPEPEDCLAMLYHAPGAMFADYLAVAADAWISKRETNPITGREWELGDMERAVVDDLGLHRGLIDEQIMLCGFGRDGDSPMVTLPYKHDVAARKVRWSAPIVTYEQSGIGRFPRVAAEGFARPDLLVVLCENMGGPPPADFDVESFKRRAAVTSVHSLPERFRVIEGPKGPPLWRSYREAMGDRPWA